VYVFVLSQNTTYSYVELSLSAYLHFGGTIGPYQTQDIQNRN
jgi:hypothetical protein